MKCESYPSIFENILEIFFIYYPMLATLGTMDLTDTETEAQEGRSPSQGHRKRGQEIKGIVIPNKPRREDGSRNREHSGVSSDI